MEYCTRIAVACGWGPFVAWIFLRYNLIDVQKVPSSALFTFPLWSLRLCLSIVVYYVQLWRLRTRDIEGRSQDFSKGESHCVKVTVLTRLSLWPTYRHGISPPVVGCLVKKGLQKGRSRAPQDPPLATSLDIDLTHRGPWQLLTDAQGSHIVTNFLNLI